MSQIFHLALASEWAAAQAAGVYTTSTLGRSLADEGFIHASRADQWTGVRDRFYADVAEPLVLLQIDTDLLDVPVVEEPPAPGVAETFPHIYGPLAVSAVVKAIPLATRRTEAATEASAYDARPVATVPDHATPAGTPARPSPPQESFTRLYFREVFFNVALVCVALAVSLAGIGLGRLVHEDLGPAVGGVLGLVLGGLLAVRLYRRRHARS